MTKNTGTMVIAGRAGGKSTFIGALATYVREIRGDKWQGDYEVVYGDESEFEDHIYSRMSNNMSYPEATTDTGTYLVRVRSHTDAGYTAEKSLSVMDIPGERQEAAVDRLVAGDWTEDEVIEAYEEGVSLSTSIRDKIQQEKALSNEEEEMLFIYQYLASNRVIVLLNLHKYIEDYGRYAKTLSRELIEEVAADRRCLLLVTAADKVDYDPDTFRSGMLSRVASSVVGSPRMYDVSLEEHLKQTHHLPPNQAAGEIKSLVRAANSVDASMFSVAVPAESEQRIAVNNGHIETRGFDNVAEWLFNT